MVVPAALKVLRLKPERKFCRLGDMASQYGWKHNQLIARLESARKVKSSAFFTKQKAAAKAVTTAKKGLKLDAADTATLAEVGL